ncbi:MAG: signal recognition particle-docking protein FtsY [Zetaproteobacteria bacterium CG12_big_fil_rev_8_21_14_0_65_55_1124]|nr:MAG: signal recognition particle-docking protein FtsY [Zetaproteobacteria bacterium CG1_02_55_237]PIS19711.1 MAG: signal recognition particle-docking protein FtsY [Zetaproteobacteria bacterium CG08_land_8_20_14_0_20_55_17]PIW43477.1 MAG: signal recognition particle-docking protein FtsY [Zetaproteobacteria bacterium CG12_big_fil_rev_8_21_14_0_65_55_1124]PIY54109.1 MAG: signal recognition particle-docking protein FtsY [Zetaproteobacteria bacterium CG_4_10_14_0_8_um_filter_55_43]PIZ39102.1 MAG:
MSLFSRLKQGLSRSRENLSQLLPGRDVVKLSETEWADVEDGLILADCGAQTSLALVGKARKAKQPLDGLKTAMLQMFPEVKPLNLPSSGPFVLLVVGVNGTGKTTTIGKLATMFRAEGKRVVVGACDTFRAAAIEQLAVWVERAGADMVRQHDGADPAAVAYDAVQRGISRDYDVVIIDTAGRVQTDKGLMDELGKVRRVIGKALDGAPHEVWQVVDAGTGQNAVAQVEKFREVAGTSGLIVTKLDGTGKGGIVLQLVHRFGLPVRYVGVGETLADMMPFDATDFVNGLIPEVGSDNPENETDEENDNAKPVE